MLTNEEAFSSLKLPLQGHSFEFYNTWFCCVKNSETESQTYNRTVPHINSSQIVARQPWHIQDGKDTSHVTYPFTFFQIVSQTDKTHFELMRL